jgi:uncharacterized membrane protein YczE
MPITITILRWILRIAFLIAFILGCALWSGHGYAYLQFHMWLGFIITFALLAIVILSLIARMKPALPLIAFLWAVALPVFGIAQLKIMPGPNHWIPRVLHLILGLGAIGLGESLSKKVRVRFPA